MAAVLIVDDDKNIRTVFKRFLMRHDYEVVCADTVAVARACLESQDFDIILLDIRMPGGCGDQVLQQLRAFEHPARVIVSSVFSVEEQKRVIPDAQDYFDKSDGLTVLLNKIKNVEQQKEGGVL
jgi:two-component system, OmpR family, KDP operon response regulator KdpE